MPASWQGQFFENLVSAAQAAGDERLATARLHRRKKTASFAHSQVRNIECQFGTSRNSGSQAQVLLVECQPKRGTEIDAPVLKRQMHEAGIGRDGERAQNGGRSTETNPPPSVLRPPTLIGTLGRIDILARDRNTGDYVVIELKRDQGDDEVIGQCSRYMGWIKQHRAESAGAGVRGIIVAHEATDRLRSAASAHDNITVYTYQFSVGLTQVATRIESTG